MASADLLIEIFNEAKVRPEGAERDAFLAGACRGEAELMEQVASLLRSNERAGDFFLKHTQLIPPADPLTEKPGDRIGRYKLLEQIGEGGCGVVYMAEQEEPVRRRVALKVIKLGMDTRQVMARFEAERQALAMMDHPNIAKVLDGGATDTGRPFFVMELVRGIKITDYCDQNNLSTKERLELFIRVCQAIQHAHQKGIIHRDIKPSNILVTHHDNVAVPKVIDFGIAKATTGHLTDKTLFTAFAQFMGTPAYMSPEQAQMSGLDIDTRSDIYSLGVLFYELLTGNPPFDTQELLNAGFDEMRRIIRETEPPKPSTRVTHMRSGAGSNSSGPSILPTPHPSVDRDLDWIVMKCLEKDRVRRYETANDVAMDIQRHLKSEPVLACPPSAAYRFRKFGRRNKAVLVMTTALGLAAILTVVGLLISNRLVTREKEEKEAALADALKEKARADRNLSKAREAVKEYLLKASENPILQSGDFQGLRKELMETAIPFYEEFVRQDQQNPELEFERGAAYDDLGFLREGIGESEQAVADFARSREIFQRLAERFPDKSVYRLRLAEARNSRGGVLKDLGRFDAAEQEFRQALAELEPLLSAPGAPAEYRESLARIQGNLGALMRDSGRLPEAEALLHEAVATREKLLEQKPDSLALRGQLSTSWNTLGTILSSQHKSGEAEKAFEKALAVLDAGALKQITDDTPMQVRFEHLRAQAWNNLGSMRQRDSRFADAEAAFREALTIKKKLADTFPSIPQHRQELAASYNNLGTLVSGMDRPEEARAAYQRAIELYEGLITDFPADTRYPDKLAGTWSNMGRLLGDEGRLEEALPWITKAIDSTEATLQRDMRAAEARETLLVASWTRAMTLCGLDRYDEAVKDWDRAIELDSGRHRLELRLKRASNLLNVKDHARATADAAAIAESPDARAEDLYNAAGIHSICSQLAAADGTLTESYARRAVQILRQAIAKGYKDFARIKTHPDLEAIRPREDFQRLIKELESKASGKESEQ